ncbi:germacradienol/geosmin synthase [Streptomyces sp. NPDC014733]|uniref:terpene synthase family protein n=1 Tax=Streptomyces sp. NPDC014733 TaxID=3364885 RepID=UPI0036FF2FFF
MPDLYRPWPAHLNPHLPTARHNARRWAERMGFLDCRGPDGSPIWTPTALDAMDYALMNAYVHPRCPRDTLDLLTAWYVWVFFFDDRFLRCYKDTGDYESAKSYVERLALFCPSRPTPVPRPTNPDENALTDLWHRTVSGMSEHFQRRFSQSCRHLIINCLHEVTAIKSREIFNPLAYMKIRRTSGGAPWSADLVELATGRELPAALATAQEIQVLKETFADGVHLLNDLFSYQRETESEGELNNGVLVARNFLGTSLQDSAEWINQVRTARLRQFARTARHDLPRLFAEHRATGDACGAVQAWVQGLKDWTAGSHEWHARSSRYMNNAAHGPRRTALLLRGPSGPGTSSLRRPLPAPRIPGRAPIPSTPGYRFALPSFDLPWPSRRSPHLAPARDRTRTWARTVGLLAPPLWTEESFNGEDWPLFAALTHPDADEEQLTRVCQWDMVALAIDDYMARVFKKARDTVGAAAFVDRIPLFMPGDLHATPAPANPVEAALADAWARTAPHMPPALRRRFPDGINDFAATALWELDHSARGLVPEPVDYLEMRRRTSGTPISIALTVHTPGHELPVGVWEREELQTLVNAYADTIGIRNDIYSYAKETEEEGELCNGVLVLERFFGCPTQQAVDIAYRLFTQRTQEFVQTERTAIPAMCEDMCLTPQDRARIDRFITTLKEWLAGDNQWYRQTTRYTRGKVCTVNGGSSNRKY